MISSLRKFRLLAEIGFLGRLLISVACSPTITSDTPSSERNVCSMKFLDSECRALREFKRRRESARVTLFLRADMPRWDSAGVHQLRHRFQCSLTLDLD